MTRRTELGRAARAVLLALGLGLGFACEDAERTGPQAGSETHFLTRCSTACAGGFDCVCGVCTLSCADSTTCSAVALPAECAAPRDCSEPYPKLTCDVACSSDTDCGAVGPLHTCDAGFCRAPATNGEIGAGGAPPLVPPAQAGAGGGSEQCEDEPVPSNQIVVLGDSVIELSGMAGYLEQLARDGGALADDATYRNHASALTSFLAENGLNIATQYDAALTEGPIEAVIMNGGATDMLQTGCDPPSADCATVVDAMAGANALFERMASDGVASLVYFFYADPVNNPALLTRLDVLRPLIQELCETGPVPCRFLDLRPAFADHYPDYISATDASGIVFSPAGAQEAARLVYEEMRAACVVR